MPPESSSPASSSTTTRPRWRDLPLYERVVVRQRIDPENHDGFKYSDVKGIAYHIDESGILLQPEVSDSFVYLTADQIEAAKVIPPRPEPRPRVAGSTRSTAD